MALIHFTKEGFDKALASNAVILADFWATWCTHCKPLSPIMEQLADEYADDNVIVGKIDVDENPELAMRYGVMGVPTVILFQSGEEKDRKVGAMPYDVYADLLDGALDHQA